MPILIQINTRNKKSYSAKVQPLTLIYWTTFFTAMAFLCNFLHAFAKSQHLFSSRVTSLPLQYLVFMMVESYQCLKAFAAHPKYSQGLRSGLYLSVNWCLISSKPLFHNLKLMNLGILILPLSPFIPVVIRGGKKNLLMENPGYSVYSGRQLTSIIYVCT